MQMPCYKIKKEKRDYSAFLTSSFTSASSEIMLPFASRLTFLSSVLFASVSDIFVQNNMVNKHYILVL